MSAEPLPFVKQEPPTDTQKRSLVRKLAEVMAAVERVAKRGRNEFHRYDYVTEADLADAIRKELAQRHLFIFPSVSKCERTPIEVESSRGIRKTQLTEISVEWTFVDGESGEERTITVHGVGEDNVDKGFYKAFTGSEKYMLMKSFLIPTGDDPEKDSRDDAKAAKERGKGDAKSAGQAKSKELATGDQKTLFYTYPEKHNGHFAEFINVKAFGSALNEVAQEGLRLTFKKYMSKTFASKDSIVVPQENMDALLNELKDCGVPFHKLGATE